MNNETPEYLLWLDFETTGLVKPDPIQVAVVLTRADDLQEISAYETLIDTAIDPWTWEALGMHATSGLVTDWLLARKARTLASVTEAQYGAIDLLRALDIDEATLAGSGVGTFDLPLIRRCMPRLAEMLTYHVHDVGVLRRAYRRATGTDLTPRTEPEHRAMADVQQSLAEGRAFADLFRAKAE